MKGIFGRNVDGVAEKERENGGGKKLVLRGGMLKRAECGRGKERTYESLWGG